MEEIMKGFQNPPTEYRPAPLWVWNDEMTTEQIDCQLTELSTHGFGGAFVHPRPGLVTEYLSEDWFRLWGHALEKSKELGMKLSIYDENSYPSGFAGGHVSGLCPEALSTLIRYQVVDNPSDVDGDLIAIFAAREEDGRLVHAKDLSSIPRSQWSAHGDRYIAITGEKTPSTGWMAGFSYVDLLRPQVTEAFLRSTHEQYYARFGADFGKAIPSIFTDEPSVSQCGGGSLPFSFWFAHEFRKRNGYDLIANLPCVFADVEGDFTCPPGKVRFDYYDTIHELWVKNSIEPTGTWCREHGINWTGHYLEHQWPHVSFSTSPAVQSNYEYHQWPAIDMLLSSYLKDRPTHSLTHTIRELKSAVNQFGKERALCELYGAGGWDSTFDDYKRMADWVMVNGVNFINQHLTYSTIMGARKHDHPQSFDWREPWWDEYASMNDYLGRASWLLTRGRMEQRILVLNPSTTAYLTEAGQARGSMFDNGSLDCIVNPDMSEFLTLCQNLSDLQWDFDLGDEYTLARHGKADGNVLQVACQRYSCVILSGSMQNMLSSTVELLKACLRSGVAIAAVGDPGCYVDGIYDEETYAGLASQWTSVGQADIDGFLESLLPRRIAASVPFPEGFGHMRRRLDNGDEIWFFANQSMGTYEADIRLHGRSAKQLDMFTGQVRIAPYAREDGMLAIPVSLVRNQSLMLLVSHSGQDISPSALPEDSSIGTVRRNMAPPARKDSPADIPLRLEGILQETDNLYPVSYADYGSMKDTYVKTLCDRIYRERGFPSNPWDNKVQFRRNILDRQEDYGNGSGFKATYHFTVEEGFLPDTIFAVAEHPEHCRLRVNGSDVPWIPGETYLDHHFGVADIAGCVKTGENALDVVVDTFHVLMELDTVYIKGSFSVVEKDCRWVLSAPSRLSYGSWRQQGLPFYPYAVRYAYTALLDRIPRTASIDLADYNATAVSLTVNGRKAGLLHADGKRAADIAPFLQQGENRIVLRVCGSHKNLLGPHFVRERGSAWPAMWRQSPEHTPQPSGYDLLDFGLQAAPVLRVAE